MEDSDRIGQVVRFIVRARGPVLRVVAVCTLTRASDKRGQEKLMVQNICIILPTKGTLPLHAVRTFPVLFLERHKGSVLSFK